MNESTEQNIEENTEKETLTRRGFIGAGSAALAAAGILTASGATGQEQGTHKQDRSKSESGAEECGAGTRRMRIPSGHPPPIPRAWCKRSNIRSRLRTKRTYEGGMVARGGPFGKLGRLEKPWQA